MTIWHTRILEIVEELGGGTMLDIRRRFIEKYGESFGDHETAIVNGTAHWYRKVQWARNDLVKEGKLVQDGEWISFPKKEINPNPSLYDPAMLLTAPAMNLPAAVVIHIAVLLFFVLLLVKRMVF